jgi:hypothetical protein
MTGRAQGVPSSKQLNEHQAKCKLRCRRDARSPAHVEEKTGAGLLKGTGDYNGDQKSDILWQGADGTPAIWFMDGMNFIGGSAAGSFNPGPDWHVIA